MSEPAIRRVVIACDAACEIGGAVSKAAALAARWRVPMHGIFLENENLFRLAQLPFSRQVTLSFPEVSQSLQPNELADLLSALAATMRRMLAEVAAREGLGWTFAVVRDLPSAAALAATKGDMLVIEASARPFSGSWGPRSLWESVASDCNGIVLLRRDEAAGDRRVALVLRAAAGEHEKILRAGLVLSRPRDQIVILLIGEPRDGQEDAVKRHLASQGFPHASLERVTDDPTDIGRRLRGLNVGLVVIEPLALASTELRAFIADTHCDVLLVG
jgi:hypothetical protein